MLLNPEQYPYIAVQHLSVLSQLLDKASVQDRRATTNLYRFTAELFSRPENPPSNPKLIVKRSVVGRTVTAVCIDGVTGEFIQLSGPSDVKSAMLTIGRMGAVETSQEGGISGCKVWSL